MNWHGLRVVNNPAASHLYDVKTASVPRSWPFFVNNATLPGIQGTRANYWRPRLTTQFHAVPHANSLAISIRRMRYLHYSRFYTVKATFHCSSQLQTWLQTWFSTRFAARFSTSTCGYASCFRHAFDFFVENLVANPCRDWCSRFVGSCAC